MSSSPSNSDFPKSETLDPKTLANQNLENPDEKDPIKEIENGDKEGEGEDEEEGECGFCLFMKAGGCKDAFIAWEQCIEEAEKNKEDLVNKCFEITANLKKCMEAHSEYYEPILRAEKAAEEEVKQEFEHELEKKSNEQNAGSIGIEERAEIEVEKEG